MTRPIWRLYSLLLIAVVIVADQLSKWWIVSRTFGPKAGIPEQDILPWLFQKAERLGPHLMEVTSYFNLVMVWNKGVSFGLLQTGYDIMNYVLSAFAILVSIGFVVWLWLETTRLRAVAIGLIVGGALGNVWDRLRFGAVIDFLDVHWGTWHWPAFNVADASIAIGVALLLVEVFFVNHDDHTMRCRR